MTNSLEKTTSPPAKPVGRLSTESQEGAEAHHNNKTQHEKQGQPFLLHPFDDHSNSSATKPASASSDEPAAEKEEETQTSHDSAPAHSDAPVKTEESAADKKA
jgi:hypothetical protein